MGTTTTPKPADPRQAPSRQQGQASKPASQRSARTTKVVVKTSSLDLIQARKGEIEKELTALDTSDKRAFDTLANNSDKRAALEAEFKSYGGTITTKSPRSRRVDKTVLVSVSSSAADFVRCHRFYKLAIYIAFLVLFGVIVTGIVNYLVVTLLIGYVLTGLIPVGWLFSIGIFVVFVICGILVADGFIVAREKKAELT